MDCLAKLDHLVAALRREPTSDYAPIAEKMMRILVIVAKLELAGGPRSKYWSRVVSEAHYILRGIEAGESVREKPLSGPYNFLLAFLESYVNWKRILLVVKNHPSTSSG